MKSLLITSVAAFATMSLISACDSSSGSVRREASLAGNVNSQKTNSDSNSKLVGSFKGVNAICEGGTNDVSLEDTTITFNADGTFMTEHKAKDGLTQVKGTYTVSGENLTMTVQDAGQKSEAEQMSTYKMVTDDDLTIVSHDTEDGTCPPDMGLMMNYHREAAAAPASSSAPTPSPTPTPAK